MLAVAIKENWPNGSPLRILFHTGLASSKAMVCRRLFWSFRERRCCSQVFECRVLRPVFASFLMFPPNCIEAYNLAKEALSHKAQVSQARQ